MVDYRSQNYIVHFLNGVVLTLLGVFCFLYSVYTSDFAELHIRLPFLSFPIFAGEILMLTCIIFFLVKIRYVPIKWNIWHGILVGYLCWGIVKSSQGFIAYGPLAFRNAALFYYPVFALIGYYFYEDGFIPERHKFFLLIFFAGMLLMQKVVLYYVFSYSLLFIILLLSLKKPLLKKTGVVVGIVVFFYIYRCLLGGNRSHTVGITFS